HCSRLLLLLEPPASEERCSPVSPRGPKGWSTTITDNQSSDCCLVCSLFECVPSLKVPLCVSARKQSTVNLYLLCALHYRIILF
ncbi:hypothetical protein PHET_11146, partial [Paragonimus heterotremus]